MNQIEALPAAQALELWESNAKLVLRRAMRDKKVTYADLAAALRLVGIRETADQLNRKINRKKFPAALLLACFAALDIRVIEVPNAAQWQRRKW